MSDPAHTRLGESLKGLADSGLATVQTRLELFAVELKEEKLRAGGFLFDCVLAALFLGFGVVSLLAFLTVLFWDSHRLLALGIATTGLLLAGVWAGTRAAAVTVVVIKSRGGGPRPVVFNRPFVLALTEEKSQVTLFTGIVHDPT